MKNFKITAALLAPAVFWAGVASHPDWLSKTRISVRVPAPRLSPVVASEDYPEKFALQRMDELKLTSGLKVIGNLAGLRGSFGYVEVQKLDAENALPTLLRLDVTNGVIKRHAWKLPTYNPTLFTLAFSSWKTGNRSCLLRALRNAQSDTANYRLYELDLERGTARTAEQVLSAYNRLLVSPSGKRYAYYTSEPYNEAYPQLRVANGTQYQSISKNLLSASFSWSSRDTLLFCDDSKDDSQQNAKQNLYFPSIYENDLKGHIRLIKSGGYEPLLSPDGKYLAYIGPDRGFKRTNPINEVGADASFDRIRQNRAVLRVLDLKSGRDKILAHVGDPYGEVPYPKYLWTSDERLCVIDSSYSTKRHQSSCRVHVFNSRDGQYKLKAELKQAGRNIRPIFTPLKIANGRFLLLQVNVKPNGGGRTRILTVDLKSGLRRDILISTGTPEIYGMPLLDWTDASST